MNKMASILIVIAAVSFLLALISRMTLMPIPLGRGLVESRAIMLFTNTCLIFAIAISVLQIANKK